MYMKTQATWTMCRSANPAFLHRLSCNRRKTVELLGRKCADRAMIRGEVTPFERALSNASGSARADADCRTTDLKVGATLMVTIGAAGLHGWRKSRKALPH